MDKYEYKIRAEEIRDLISKKKYAEAMKIADMIDWRRVKNVNMLCTVSDLYKINRKYEESRETTAGMCCSINYTRRRRSL